MPFIPSEITAITDQYDSLSWLECDGLSQVLHKVLADACIKHSFCVGRVAYRTASGEERLVKVHCWLEVAEGGLIVDYRLRLWLGSHPDVPHGIFNPDDYTNIKYVGKAVEVVIPNRAIFNALVDTELDKYIERLIADAKRNRS